MYRPLLLIFFVLTLPNLIGAQKPKTITLADQSIPALTQNFKLVKIIDARTNKNNIGQVQTGLLNTRRPAVMVPFEQELSNLLVPCFRGTEKELIIRINAFEVSEWTTASRETGIVSLNISFIEIRGSDIYAELYNAILSQKVNGMDVTARTANNIANTLKTASIKFLSAHQQGQLSNKIIDAIDLNIYTPPPVPMAPLTNDFIIYEHYMDFINGQPMTLKGYKIKGYDNILNIKVNGNSVTNIWGAQHNGSLYIMMNKRLRKLNQGTDNYQISLQDIDAGSVAMYGALFGFLGSAIATAESPYRTFEIDPLTGQLNINQVIPTPVNPLEVYGDKSILQISPYGKRKDTFTINGSETRSYNLTRSQYILMPPESTTLNVCHNESNLCTDIEIPEKPVFVRLRNKKGELEVVYMSPEQKRGFLKSIDEKYRID